MDSRRLYSERIKNANIDNNETDIENSRNIFDDMENGGV